MPSDSVPGQRPCRSGSPHGVRGGVHYGATDDFGYRAVHNRVHFNDLHATLLHLMGLDHERLTFRHGGRDYRLTDVHGRVVSDILA